MTHTAPAISNDAAHPNKLEVPKNAHADTPLWGVAIAPVSFLLTLLLIIFFLRP